MELLRDPQHAGADRAHAGDRQAAAQLSATPAMTATDRSRTALHRRGGDDAYAGRQGAARRATGRRAPTRCSRTCCSSVLAQVPPIDASARRRRDRRLRDARVRAGNERRAHRRAARRIAARASPGMTINRFCSSGLNAVSIAADRIRTGEADIMIAAGTESMSMIPMLGRLALNADVFARRRERRHRLRHGAHRGKASPRSGRSRARTRTPSRWHRTGRRSRRRRRGEFDAEISPYPTSSHASPTSRPARVVERSAQRRARRRAARRHDRRGPRQAEARIRGEGLASPPATARRCRTAPAASILVSERVLRELGLAPLARWVGYAVAGVPPEFMGIGPDRGDSQGARRSPASASRTSTGSS